MLTLRHFCYACFLVLQLGTSSFSYAAEFKAAPQKFLQEVATRFARADGVPAGGIQLMDMVTEGLPAVFSNGKLFELREGRCQTVL